ncbi:MAG: SH3 domain-containing protein [Nitrosomonas sp.]|nr:SH3 domain-containing protein [Nitrosomonas sp.]MDP1949673.1 SH3 domain-containing protein [Nitrosomonas sp.]
MFLKTVRQRHWFMMMLLVVSLANYERANAGVEFLSTSDDAVIMYDAPSLKAEKLYVATRFWPVEALVNVDGWVKVRDSSGSLAWVEQKALSNQRYVIVTVPQAKVYQAADVNAELVFQVQERVVMEWLESIVSGWVKVQHRDGQTGYIQVHQVWGS